jgi:hypothetical protein
VGIGGRHDSDDIAGQSPLSSKVNLTEASFT